MKRQFVKAASSAQMINAFEAKLAEMKGSNIESATEISASNLTEDQKELIWEIANRYATSWPLSGKWSDETAHEQRAIAEELGVSLAEAKQIMIDELGFDPNLYSEDDHWADEDVKFATDVKCDEYIDTDGMFGEPGAIVTDDEMHAYWDAEHEDDPVLAEYPDFESWWSDTKQWMKPTDSSYADFYVDNQLDSAWGDNAESTMYRSFDSSTEEVDEKLDPVRGDQEWGDDQVFMLMDYTAGDEGMESDSFDCYGKFFAVDEADANRQLEEVKQADPDRMSHLDGAYIQAYNDYFDDGDEVYPNLATLVKSTWIAPNDYDGNMYDEDLPFASTQVDGSDVTASELIMDGEEVAEPLEEDVEDVECSDDMFTDIEQDIAKDAEEEPIEAGLFDDYFGKEQAAKYGDLIASNLSGQTVSKRRDLAEEPGGLIYEANLLGIDMWDLLEALEGMCYQGRAVEIDDSTYRVK